jgi:uncharacterized integral membrane protein (TIGR00697 family)
MHNICILIFQILIILFFIIFSTKYGESVLNSWLCFLAVAMNIFVLKQITLFNLNVTATDAIAVSYLLGLNVLQEYFGKKAARKHALLAIFISSGFLIISIFHLLYKPNIHDFSDDSYKLIFGYMPRLVISSFTSFFLVQISDIFCFSWIRHKLNGKFFFLRLLICGAFAQILDTLLFTFLGLYGVVENIFHIVFISILFKFFVLFLSVPFISLCKKFIKLKS